MGVEIQTKHTFDKDNHTFNTYTHLYYNVGGFYKVLEVFNTWNCQMSVLAGIEDVFNLISYSSVDVEIKKMFKLLYEKREKPLVLVDVNDTIRSRLIDIVGNTNIVMDSSFESTNGNTRHILVFNIKNL